MYAPAIVIMGVHQGVNLDPDQAQYKGLYLLKEWSDKDHYRTYIHHGAKQRDQVIKSIRLREGTSFQMVNSHKQRAITTDSMLQYGPLSNLKKTSWY